MSSAPEPRALTVDAAMTRTPHTLTEAATLDEAITEMDRHGICHLPVVRDGQLVGVVSDRDLLEATGWLPARVRSLVRGLHAWSTVEPVMRTDVVIARPGQPVLEAATEMLTQGVGCLPVLEDEAVVGILARSDVLRVYMEACQSGLLGSGLDPAAQECASRDVFSLSVQGTLGDAHRLCVENDVRHLPILADGRLVGVISDRDLRAAHGRGRSSDYPIDSCMSAPPIVAHPETPLTRCAERMLENKIACLPLVHDDQVVAMLSGYDIVRFLLSALAQD